MKRALARSFVVTMAFSPAACSKPEPPRIHANPPGTATATPTVAAPTAEIKKRKHGASDGGAWRPATDVPFAELVSQQPKDSSGRTIFVAPDDRCYVEEPMKPPYPPLPTGARAVTATYVDCPAALDDPAWDTCTASTLSYAPSKGQCFCVPVGGNPPPPPQHVRCPKEVQRGR